MARVASREYCAATEEQNVLVETETGVRTIPFAQIDRARLVPKIEWRKAK